MRKQPEALKRGLAVRGREGAKKGIKEKVHDWSLCIPDKEAAGAMKKRPKTAMRGRDKLNKSVLDYYEMCRGKETGLSGKDEVRVPSSGKSEETIKQKSAGKVWKYTS